MTELMLFWAKLGSATWPECYHPVICHLIDVAAVAQQLWDSAIRSRVKQWVTRHLNLPSDDVCARWLAFWVGAHDIGKLTPGFQSQGNTNALVARLPDWFRLSGDSKPHGSISTKVLAELLESPGGSWPAIPKVVAQNVAVAVGGHHGIFPTNWVGICGALGNEKWTAARSQVLTELARVIGVNGQPSPLPGDENDQSVWMHLAGLTSVADWIGSNQEFFKPAGCAALLSKPMDLENYFKRAKNQAKQALQALGWDRAETTAPVTFAQLFPFEPRPLQRDVATIASGMTEPGLLIVEAPMGEGKTEAAWYAASCWDRRGGQGTYVALPTMATSNQMFGRVESFLKSEGGEGKKNLMLQHGKAALNERFEKLKYAARVYDDETKPSAVVAEAWFAANKKHGLLAPYGVGTIDQALLAVLQTKHVFVRLFGLAGKCVILDEVHAYDAYMTTLMERLLRWLSALGCSVVLLSATLPREKRLRLLRAYAGNDAEPPPVDYPRISWTMGGKIDAMSIKPDEASKRREKMIFLDWTTDDGLAALLKDRLTTGGCAAVIRNTVGLAQETFLRLRDAFKTEIERGEIRLGLFHARFPFGRRQAIEDEVLDMYGKGANGEPANPKRPPKAILVATQVIEQSLDLDFDMMVSDVAPVDLVLQRAGRLHRHERGTRPGGVNEPRLWLIEPGSKGGLPDFGRSEYVYARFILLRSFLVLKSSRIVRLPDDLERFVEQVYGSETLAIPEGWQTALDEAKRKLDEEQRTQRSKAKGLMIYRPDDEDLLRQQNVQLDEDNPEAAENIRAATRDTEPTIQLVLIFGIDGRDFLDPAGSEPFSELDKPDISQVRRVLENEVTINHRGCVDFYARRPVPAGWRERGMLRHHRVVRLDTAGDSHSDDDYPLRFDVTLGIVFTRDIKEKESR